MKWNHLTHLFRTSEAEAATISTQQRILLEPLDTSCTDRVYATLLTTSVASDDKTAILMTPNGLTQERIIQTALKSANILPHDIDYIETHGTRTTLGDPIAIGTLTGFFREIRSHTFYVSC